MKQILCFLITAVTFLFGCNQHGKQKTDGFSAKHIIDINDPIDVSIDDFVTDIDTIRLEVTDASLMNRIDAAHIMDDRFYILTNNSTMVFIFDLKGRYLTQINDKGQGPNEYLSIKNMQIDPVNKRLILTDNFSKKILVYNAEGKQVDVIQLDFHPLQIASYKNEYIHFCSGSVDYYKNPKMDDFHIHYLDSGGRYVSSAIEKKNKKDISVMSDFRIEILENGDILYQPMMCYVVYKISGDEVSPYYEFNNLSRFKSVTDEELINFKSKYGEKPNDMEEKEDQGYLLTWGDVLEMKDIVLFIFRGNEKYRYSFFNKKNLKSSFVDPERMKGDEDVIHFFLRDPCCVDDDRIYIAPSEYRTNRVKGKMKNEKVRTFLENMDLDSNPVLLSFKVKLPE